MAKPGRKKAPVAAAGIVRAWPFLKPDPEYAEAFREMAAPPVLKFKIICPVTSEG